MIKEKASPPHPHPPPSEPGEGPKDLENVAVIKHVRATPAPPDDQGVPP